jgi:hypothetical protein
MCSFPRSESGRRSAAAGCSTLRAPSRLPRGWSESGGLQWPPRPRGTSPSWWRGAWSGRPARPAGTASPPTGPSGPRRCWLRCCTPLTCAVPVWNRCSGGCCARTSTHRRGHWRSTASTWHPTCWQASRRPTSASCRGSSRAPPASSLPTAPTPCSTARPPSTSTRVGSRVRPTPSTCAPRPATRTWSPRSWWPFSNRPAPGAIRLGHAGRLVLR